MKYGSGVIYGTSEAIYGLTESTTSQVTATVLFASEEPATITFIKEV